MSMTIAPAPQATLSAVARETRTHYVRATDLDAAWLDGVPLTALCGKRWIPNADPDKHPLCTTCRERRAAFSARSDG